MSHLSPETIARLKHYVYILTDPLDRDKPFYVGKGKGDRVNNHEEWALKNETNQSGKVQKILEIKQAGLEVGLTIVRHGLETDHDAFIIECALIDFIGIKNLTNKVEGHGSDEFGIAKLKDLELKYQAEDVDEITEPVILIKINKLFTSENGMSNEQVLEITRKFWRIDIERAKNVRVVCAVHLGVVRGVFIAEEWHQGSKYPGKLEDKNDEDRVYFDGKIAPKDIQDRYYEKSVRRYVKSTQNPIRYINA